MYNGNPGEIDFGQSQRGFELSGVNCISSFSVILIKSVKNFIRLKSSYTKVKSPCIVPFKLLLASLLCQFVNYFFPVEVAILLQKMANSASSTQCTNNRQVLLVVNLIVISFCKTIYFVTLACFSVILIYLLSLFSYFTVIILSVMTPVTFPLRLPRLAFNICGWRWKKLMCMK